MMREKQTTERNKLIKKMQRIYSIITLGVMGGDYDKALKNIEQEEQLIKGFQGDLPDEIKGFLIGWLWYRALIYAYRGDLALSFKDANELLMIGESYDHKWGISNGTFALGIYYLSSGDLDKALVHIDRAIRLSEEILNDLLDFIFLAAQLDLAVRISIVKEDLERAKMYFKRFEELRELKPTEFYINDAYRLSKACLLKSSM